MKIQNLLFLICLFFLSCLAFGEESVQVSKSVPSKQMPLTSEPQSGKQGRNDSTISRHKVFSPERYYFNHVPYISPMIIKDLSAWMSDSGDQVVAINLLDSQGSNRYFSEKVEVSPPKEKNIYPLVCSINEGKIITKGTFCYRLLKNPYSHYYFLETYDSGGGTGTFMNIIVLTSLCDLNILGKQRVLLKKLGEIPLGDRWDGTIKINKDQISIHQTSQGTFQVHQKSPTIIHLAKQKDNEKPCYAGFFFLEGNG